MAIKRRAINDDQKEERRQAILDAAWQLFQQNPYDAVNILDVAKAINLAKGTVYVYFKTKEALFLAIHMQQFEAWFDAVDAALPDTRGVDAVVSLFTQTLVSRPHLTRLFAILHTTLEHNIDYDLALNFKQMLYQRIGHTGALLENALDFLQPGEGVQVLMDAYAITIGVQHMADSAPVVDAVMSDHPELAAFKVAFEQGFSGLFRTYLIGLHA